MNYGSVIFDPINGYVVDPLTTSDGNGNFQCSSLKAANLTYPIIDSTSGAVLTTNGAGILSLTPPKSILYASLAAQNTNLSAGDHVVFDTVNFSKGSAITLDTNSPYTTTINTASIGRISLIGSKVYDITLNIQSFSGTSLTLAIWDITNNISIFDGVPSTLANTFLSLRTIFNPLSNILIEIRLTAANSVSLLNKSFITIQEL